MFKKMSADGAEAIREVYSRGKLTMKELGKIFGRHQSVICRLVNGKTFKNVKLYSKPRRRLSESERAEIVRLTQETAMTDGEVAEKFNCSASTVLYHRQKFERSLERVQQED